MRELLWYLVKFTRQFLSVYVYKLKLNNVINTINFLNCEVEMIDLSLYNCLI